jgi:tetratricopeptide (TPR) repeat protein
MLPARALDLDPTSGEAHTSLGVLKLFYEWDWSGAEAALLRAVELNPNDAHAWHQLGNFYSAMDLQEQATLMRERSAQLDPLNARSLIVLSKAYLLTGQYDRAVELARRAQRLDPVHPILLGNGPLLPYGAAEAYLGMGRNDEAIEEYLRVATLRGATMDELAAMRAAYASSGLPGFWRSWLEMDLRQSGDSPDPVRMAALRLLTGDTAQALDWLDRAFDERNPSLIYIRREPVFADIRTHPRFERIVAAMKFPG